MLLTAEKGIQSAICHAIHSCVKANNTCMKNFHKNIECNSTECKPVEWSYLMYLDSNNLHGWGMSQKLPANGFKQVKKLIKLKG